ncbi:MAG TPA: hypothetical protein VN695_03430 [Streptosporangiaceae bacterium]|nr:hypothetical protein [Streptosporangiaceae bacterium]
MLGVKGTVWGLSWMDEDGQGSPLERRVPGATGAGPIPSPRKALPDDLIARMQAAVDAAHEAQGSVRAAAAAEPATEPLPTLRAAVAAQDWPTAGSPNGSGQRGDAWSFRLGADEGTRQSGGFTEPDEAGALDDLAESYLAADPDVTAGYADDTGADDPGLDQRWPLSAAATSGWDALRSDAEPGTDVGDERAAWWDHAVQSGRDGRAARSARSASPATPARSPQGERGKRGGAVAGVVVLTVALVAGGAVALALASRGGGHVKVARSGASKAERIKAARLASDIASAATWVAAQVDHGAKVACDPMTCQALADHGLPSQRLDDLARRAVGPLRAPILVDTPALRRQYGASLPNRAPTVLAGFGLGADRITVRVLARHGGHAYVSALRADRKERQAAGASLLTSSQVTTARAARNALVAGDVDDRLLLVITALASQHPIDIVAFGRTWPGTSAGVPMRCAYLSEQDPAAYLTKAVYVQAMISLLRAQPPTYRPVHIGLVRLAGRSVLSIWYPAPSPLGLVRTYP